MNLNTAEIQQCVLGPLELPIIHDIKLELVVLKEERDNLRVKLPVLPNGNDESGHFICAMTNSRFDLNITSLISFGIL